MGFDLMGLNPKINKDYPKDYSKIMELYGKDGWLDWSKDIPSETKERYFELTSQFEKDNPGNYFRNNVWWWRPLWDFVSRNCNRILTAKDIDRGHYNDGHKISKTKAVKIANKLTQLLKNGEVNDYMLNYEIASRQAKLDGDEFGESYPFSIDNIKYFRDFCLESGGFTIN